MTNDPRAQGRAASRRYIARQVANAPVPPDDVLARTITRDDFRQYNIYFLWGPGRDIASRTDCGHGYNLTDSCPCCDADDYDNT